MCGTYTIRSGDKMNDLNFIILPIFEDLQDLRSCLSFNLMSIPMILLTSSQEIEVSPRISQTPDCSEPNAIELKMKLYMCTSLIEFLRKTRTRRHVRTLPSPGDRSQGHDQNTAFPRSQYPQSYDEKLHGSSYPSK